MKCPHCRVAFHQKTEWKGVGEDAEGNWFVGSETCPTCQKLILALVNAANVSVDGGFKVVVDRVHSFTFIRPKAAMRPPCAPEVPRDLASDFNEACLVIADSPKASAALSRRCLQHLLRDTAKVKPSVLAQEIQDLLGGGTLPSYLAEAIDGVRNIGNFAAHPIKSTASGEVIDVEPGEAEWNLDTLESLFDFYFVQPETLKKRRAAVNAKLESAGKPPMKGGRETNSH